MTRPVGLGARLFVAQLVIIVLAGAALAATVAAVAPNLFLEHLAMTGEDSALVQAHALEAFESSVRVAFLAAAFVAVIAAVLLSWYLSRRVSRPVEELAEAAETVAGGSYDVTVPHTAFGPELASLSDAFQSMADQLAATDAARSSLLADLAHELRTPLATLEVHVDGMEDGIVPATSESFDVMRAQVARLRRLASDLRLAAAAQEHALDLHPEPVAVSDLLRIAVDAARPRYAAGGVELRFRCEGPNAVVSVDPDRIQQVLANLLDNALRHTPAGGTVTVTGGFDGPGVIIEITDTGAGIPPDQLDAIFTRFHRVDPARRSREGGGSGLGLTIARAIIEDHGGSVRATSPGPGRGATLTVRLPGTGSGSDGVTPAALTG